MVEMFQGFGTCRTLGFHNVAHLAAFKGCFPGAAFSFRKSLLATRMKEGNPIWPSWLEHGTLRRLRPRNQAKNDKPKQTFGQRLMGSAYMASCNFCMTSLSCVIFGIVISRVLALPHRFAKIGRKLPIKKLPPCQPIPHKFRG